MTTGLYKLSERDYLGREKEMISTRKCTKNVHWIMKEKGIVEHARSKLGFAMHLTLIQDFV